VSLIVKIFLRHYTRSLDEIGSYSLIIDISVAILSTKIPILLGHGFGRFTVGKLPTYGFWSMAHEARVDYAMLLGSIFLLIVGAGTWSIDARLSSIESRPILNQKMKTDD